MKETIYVLIGVGSLVGLLMFGSAIGILYMWIKYSWTSKYRQNSQNLSGKDATAIILEKNGMADVRIKSSFIIVKYWNHNFRRKTYKLRPWTHNRRSVWTMMEASQQAFVSSLRKTKKAAFIMFRFPFILKFVGFLVGVGGLVIAFKYGGNYDSWKFISICLVSVFSIFVAFSYAEIYTVRLLQKNVVPIVEKDLKLNAKEVSAIKKIYELRVIFAVAYAIYQLIKLVIQIMRIAASSQK